MFLMIYLLNLFLKVKNKKNKEIESLQNYIVKNLEQLNNTIFVLDRAYCSYDFIKFCFKNKIKYVPRGLKIIVKKYLKITELLNLLISLMK